MSDEIKLGVWGYFADVNNTMHVVNYVNNNGIERAA